MPLLPFLTRNGTGSDFTGGLLSRKARVVTLDRQRRFFPRKINGPADNPRKKEEEEEKKYTPSYIHRFPRCEESQFRLSRGDSRRGVFFFRLELQASFLVPAWSIVCLSAKSNSSSTGFGLGWPGNAWIATHFEFSNFRILGIWILWGRADEVIAYAVCQLGLSLRRKSVTLISRRSDLLSFRVERDIRGEEGHRNGWWEIFRGKKKKIFTLRYCRKSNRNGSKIICGRLKKIYINLPVCLLFLEGLRTSTCSSNIYFPKF